MSYDPSAFDAVASELCATVRAFAARGFTPATSSNFSHRMRDGHIAITISGRDKTRLQVSDLMVIDDQMNAVGSEHRPSAETRLHTQIYAMYPNTQCVLHTHSLNQTVASRLFASQGVLHLEGYELQKALQGQHTHEGRVTLPVFANTQDMQQLCVDVERFAEREPLNHGYLIEGHGLYTWGRSLAEAARHLDAWEFLLACELDMRRLRT